MQEPERTLKRRLYSHLHASKYELPQDYETYGASPKVAGKDCANGCAFFIPLVEPITKDWGVCVNPYSHRSGLLTFARQGCLHHQPANELGSAPQFLLELAEKRGETSSIVEEHEQPQEDEHE